MAVLKLTGLLRKVSQDWTFSNSREYLLTGIAVGRFQCYRTADSPPSGENRLGNLLTNMVYVGNPRARGLDQASALESCSVSVWKWWPITASVMAVPKERRWRVAAVSTNFQ